MLQAYRHYFDVVMAGYLAAEPFGSSQHKRLERLRQDGRLARTNAGASLSRLASEAASRRETVDRYQGVLASASRFATAAAALEALLPGRESSRAGGAPPALTAFVRDVDEALDGLAGALSSPEGKLGAISNLGVDMHAPWDAVAASSELQPDMAPWLALAASECDRLTEAVNSIADLLGGAPSTAAAVA